MNKKKYVCIGTILTVAIMAALFRSSMRGENHIFYVEPEPVHSYMTDPTADIYEYVHSDESSKEARLDQPAGILLKWAGREWAESYRIHITSETAGLDVCLECQEPQMEVYNWIPGVEYSYKVYGITKDDKSRLIDRGRVNPSGRVRMLKIDSIYNVRDLGGWETESGGRVCYGKVFRGSEMNGLHNIVIDEEEAKRAAALLGITADLDLRTSEESQGITSSPLGDEVEYIHIPIGSYADYDGSQSLEQIVDLLLKQETVYIHCWGGCDRTGTICWLLLGVLGVPEEELVKDYELSSFSIFGVRDHNTNEYTGLREKIDSYPGITLQNKIENYFMECGVAYEKIEELRNILIEENISKE